MLDRPISSPLNDYLNLKSYSSVNSIHDFYEYHESNTNDIKAETSTHQNHCEGIARSTNRIVPSRRHSACAMICSQIEQVTPLKFGDSDASIQSVPNRKNSNKIKHCNIPHSKTSHNEMRKQRRKEQLRLVMDELIDLVCEIYARENKVLLFPAGCDPVKEWGHVSFCSNSDTSSEGEDQENDLHGLDLDVVNAIRNFVMTFPSRYALGVESPGEVLVHMRLVSVVKSDPARAAAHVMKLEKNLHLVTLCCGDFNRVLPYVTNLLCSGSNQILDTNCMLTSENINLIRIVVDVKSSLRLDKLQQYLELFIQASRGLLSVHSDNINDKGKFDSKEEDKATNISDLPIAQQIGYVNSLDVHFHSFDRGETLSCENEHQLQNRNFSVKGIDSSELCFDKFYTSSGGFDEGSLQFVKSKKPVPLSEIITRSDIDICSDWGNSSSRSNGILSGEISNPTKNRRRRSLIKRPASSDLGLSVDGQSDILSASQQSTTYVKSKFTPQDVIVDGIIRDGSTIKIYRGYFHPAEQPHKDEEQVTDSLPRKFYAFKTAVSDTLDEDDTLQALIKEGYLAQKLQHANVCQLIDILSHPECVCLAYEYCVGGTLASLIQDKSRIYDFLPFVMDIANGMSYLHSLSIIHRDLKPSNIFLDHRNHVKIGDFGMSMEHNGEYMAGETGTYRWMAPEVIRHEHYSINADIYSFGIIFWQLVSRNPKPYDCYSPIQAAFACTKGERPTIPTTIPSFLRQMITYCWDDDQFKRPCFTNICMALKDYAHKSTMLRNSSFF